jgi:hypothetical protein
MNIIDLVIYIIVGIGAFGLIALFYDYIIGRTSGSSIFPTITFGGRKRK